VSPKGNDTAYHTWCTWGLITPDPKPMWRNGRHIIRYALSSVLWNISSMAPL
jgi:hypothetical protein